jgi:hypothetical protein
VLRKVAGGKWRFEEATPKPLARRPTLRTQEMRRTRATRRAFVNQMFYKRLNFHAFAVLVRLR